MKERKIFEIIKKLNEAFIYLNPEKNTLISIVDIKLPKKGGVMKIWLSIYPREKEKDIIKELSNNQKKIISYLKKLKLKYLPRKIIFIPSDIFARASEIYKIINETQEEIKKHLESRNEKIEK